MALYCHGPRFAGFPLEAIVGVLIVHCIVDSKSDMIFR